MEFANQTPCNTFYLKLPAWFDTNKIESICFKWVKVFTAVVLKLFRSCPPPLFLSAINMVTKVSKYISVKRQYTNF